MRCIDLIAKYVLIKNDDKSLGMWESVAAQK